MQIAFGRVRCKTEPTGVVADAWKIVFLMKFYIYIYDNMLCMESQGFFLFKGYEVGSLYILACMKQNIGFNGDYSCVIRQKAVDNPTASLIL